MLDHLIDFCCAFDSFLTECIQAYRSSCLYLCSCKVSVVRFITSYCCSELFYLGDGQLQKQVNSGVE